ncbi:MAG: hypothetical protein ACPG4T_21485 [Nannocystaceae bacterium]
MTSRANMDLKTFLELAQAGACPAFDASKPPWEAALPALAWLGFCERREQFTPPAVALTADEAGLLCDAMFTQFVVDTCELAWSSWMLDKALEAIAHGVAGPPEAMLRCAFERLRGRSLDRNVYEFCRALGRAAVAGYRHHTGWDLTFMSQEGTPSQVCLRYWTLGLKPELWDRFVEEETMAILSRYPFEF